MPRPKGCHYEWIECPRCHAVQKARVDHTIPFPTYVHTCVQCGYIVCESDWQRASEGGEMRALTIWQPWASWIIYADKRIENRPWRPPRQIIGQRIAIHAGRHFDNNAIYHGTQKYVGEWRLDRGAIIGSAVVVGVLTAKSAGSKDPWFTGPYGWELADVRDLQNPIPYRGMLGLWRVPRNISSLLLEN